MEQIRRVAWVPVLWGVLADVFLTQMMSLAIASAVGIGFDTDPEIAVTLLRASPLYWPAFGMGILLSGLGGFIAGRLAKREGAFHGTLTGFISNIVFSLLLSPQTLDTVSMAGLMLAILAGTVGGWLATLGMKSEA
jgi:putative membrane protein (TIGR04086 family)